MNEINLNLKFDEYQFRRVTRMGTNAVIYAPLDWVGKEVCIIPVGLHITDRWIDKQYDTETFQYDITVKAQRILQKTIRDGGSVGRCYMPNELVGVDCIIIEKPKYDDLY